MLTINDINKNARKIIFDDIKIPNGISNPVIREEDGVYYIAYFGYTYTKENLVEKKYKRPVRWILVDIESGKLIKTFDCSEKDFSLEKVNKLYSLDDPNVKKATADYFSIMDTLFDTTRASIIYGKEMDKASYKAYMNSLYAITPQEYRVFYKELSI